MGENIVIIKNLVVNENTQSLRSGLSDGWAMLFTISESSNGIPDLIFGMMTKIIQYKWIQICW